MAACNQPQPLGAAPTNGWDTVSAIFYSDVNAAIAAAGSSPPSFGYQSTDGNLTASGNFGHWRVTTGGSGPLIHMALPISNVVVNGDANSYASGTVTIQVEAEFLPGDPGVQNLQLQTGSHSSAMLGDAENPVSIIGFSPEPGFLVRANLETALLDWLNEHLVDFDHTFAVAELNPQTDTQAWQWTTPTHVSYAVGEPSTGATEQNSVFAVLAMTENRSAANLQQIVSEYAIPQGQRAGFLIAGERYMEKFVLPGIPALFEGTPSLRRFRLEVDGDAITITNAESEKLTGFQFEDGDEVTPELGPRAFSLELNDRYLKLILDPYTFSKGAADYEMTYRDQSILCYDSSNQLINLISDGSPVLDGSVEMKKGVLIAAIVGAVVIDAIAVALGAAIGAASSDAVEAAAEGAETAGEGGMELGEVTGEAGEDALTEGEAAGGRKLKRSILGATLGFLAGAAPATVVGMIPDFMEWAREGDLDKLPVITPFAEAVTAPIQWPNGTNFTVGSVELNSSLQFGGDPNFNHG